MTSGTFLAAASLLTMAGNLAVYYPKMTGNAAPLNPWREQGVMGLAVILAALALVSRPGIFGIVLAVLVVLPATLFLLATATSRLASQPVAVAVGQPAPDFAARDADGREFRLADLAGSPILLKFYRGYWCPYCVAELKQLDAHRAEFAALGVKLVAVSADRVDELRAFRRKHDWAILLLADPDLVVHRLYNVQQRNYTPKRGLFREMAIPTTILIGADGRVLWIDQTSDFRVRPQAAMVLAKARALLPDAPLAKAAEDCAVCAA